jgi:signal transduction histidine kinase/CheY-like chemotaxis protein
MLTLLRSNLRVQLLILFLVVLVIPFIFTAFLARRSNLEALNIIVIDSETRLVRSQAEILEVELLQQYEDVLLMAQSPIARRYASNLTDSELPNAEIANEFFDFLLTTMQESAQVFFRVQVADLQGNEILELQIDGEREEGLEELDDTLNEYSYFTDALNLPFGSVLISDYDLLTDDNEYIEPYVPVLHYSVILQDITGQARAVLIATVDLTPFLERLQTELGRGEFYLVNSTGTYIYHPDPARRYSSLLGTGFTLSSDQPNDFVTFLTDGEGYIQNSQDVPTHLQFFGRLGEKSDTNVINLDWTIIHRVSIETLLAPVLQVQLLTFTGVFVVFIIAGIVMAIFLNSMLKPIVGLATVADEVSRGNLNVKLPEIRSVNEISRLSNAFQTMLTEVKNTYGTLENRVRERTAELVHTNKELELSKNIAEEANRAKSAFLSNMSHELRTPLNVIVGYSNSMMKYPQMFDNQVLPDAYRPYAKLIEDNANYLIGLIGDVLDLSKIEAGKVELNFHTVDVVPLFRGIIDTANGLVKGKSVQIRAVYPNEIPVVWADERRLRQILLNLVSNAVKFTNTGSIVIRAVVDGKYLKISVIDGGIGISEEALQTIFDRFEQARQKDELRHQGTGLGLDISKHLAQMHGGDLTAESKLGVGSTFTLTLLLATEKQIETVQKALSSSNTQIFSGDSIDYNTLHVVVVGQGDANIRDQLRESLEQEGFAVVDTYDGNEIMDLVTGLEPSLVILDENLQHRNGLEVVRDLREETTTYHIPLLFLTQRENSASAREFAIENILIKPFNIDDVVKKVKYIIANPVSN